MDFNIFTVRKETNENEMITVSTFLLVKEDLLRKVNIPLDIYLAFIGKIQSGYNDITYHNKTHGADLSQTIYHVIMECEMLERCKVDPLEFASLIVAGCCHDHEHQ